MDANVILANNGIRAIDILSNGFLPDVIVSDIAMPIMNGHELMIKVKEDPRFALIPFVFVSGELYLEEKLDADRFQEVSHIPKSHGLEQTRVVVKEIKRLARSRMGP